MISSRACARRASSTIATAASCAGAIKGQATSIEVGVIIELLHSLANAFFCFVANG